MKVKILLIFTFTLLNMGCANHPNLRHPNSANIIITSDELKKLTPVEIILMLKENVTSDQPIQFEKTKVTFWGNNEINDLKNYLNDQTNISPVMRTSSNVACKGDEFISTIDREARHLIKAIEMGSFPLSQCSTYDLKL